MLSAFYGSKVFFNVNSRNDFHHIQIREYKESKTTIKSNGGIFECLVLVFNLSKASPTIRRSYLGRLENDLPRDNGVSISFQMPDSIYEVDLRRNPFQQGENDGQPSKGHDLGLQFNQ